MGMADGRCFTVSTSSQLFNDYVMQQNGISYADNYSYRQFLQQGGPDLMKRIQDMQDVGQIKRQSNNLCNTCDMPLLNVSKTY